MGMAELYEVYQGWCRTHQLPPFSSKEFYKIVKAELEMELGLKYRHDLVGEGGKWMRGWKGLTLVGDNEVQAHKGVSGESELIGGKLAE